MMIRQKINDFLKKGYIKMLFKWIGYFLQFVGVAALIGIFSYQTKPNDTWFGAWQFSYELSEKAALDTWEKDTDFLNRINSDSTSTMQKTLGEFRTYVTKIKDEKGDETLRLWSSSDGGVSGYLYLGGKKYAARINPETRELTFDSEKTYERPKWRWYHWLGLRPTLLMSAVTDVMKSGLTK